MTGEFPFTPTSRHWADLSGPALTALLTERSIAVVPIGAIEHHGRSSKKFRARSARHVDECVASFRVDDDDIAFGEWVRLQFFVSRPTSKSWLNHFSKCSPL